MAIADLVVVMNAGEIQHAGSTEEVYLRPCNRFTASFMGDANFLDGTAAQNDGLAVQVSTALGPYAIPDGSNIPIPVQAGDAVELCIRPEHLRMNITGPEVLDLGTARVADMAFFGTHYRCHLKLDGMDGKVLIAHYPQHKPVSTGDQVPVRVKARDVVLLKSE